MESNLTDKIKQKFMLDGMDKKLLPWPQDLTRTQLGEVYDMDIDKNGHFQKKKNILFN